MSNTRDCNITACMILIGKNPANSVNSPHLLRKTSDFDNIREPEFVKRELNARLGKETSNETFGEKMTKIKRDLGQAGQIFLNSYFSDADDPRGNLESKAFREITLDNLEDTDQQNIRYKQDEGLTQSTQFEEKEGPEPDTFEKKSVSELRNSFAANTEPDKDKNLKMHFYKHSPHKRKHKLKNDTKSLTAYLNSEDMLNALPKSFDFIALVGDNDKLVAVPAVEMNFVSAKVKRSSHFEPFFSTRFKRHNSRQIFLKDKAVDIPVLFLNTMSDFKTNKYKRSSHLDTLENKYLHEADILIQNVNASLQMMGLNDSMKPISGGFLVNPKNSGTSVIASTLSESDANNPLTASFDLNNGFLDITTKKEEEEPPETDVFKNQAEPFESGSSEGSKLANSHVTIESYKLISNLPKRQSLNEDLVNPKSVSRNFVPSEDKIFDLVKVADKLRKSDSNLKCLTGTENDCWVLAPRKHETTTEKIGTSTSCTVEVLTTSPSKSVISTTLEPTKLVNNSLWAASLEPIINITSIKNNLENTSPSSNSVNQTLTVSSINSTLQGNIINETNIYEDDSDVDNVLDLLANMSPPVTNNGFNNTPPHISISVPSIPTISFHTSLNSTPKIELVKYESTTFSTPESSTLQFPKNEKKLLSDKLHNLQKDLKLVSEVQKILSGAKKEDIKRKRSKRETYRSIGSRSRLKRRCKNWRHHQNMVVPTAINNKIKQIEGLGKILEWKNQIGNERITRNRRFLFKKKKKSKKKKKKNKKKKKGFWKRIFGDALNENEAFLGQHVQNQF